MASVTESSLISKLQSADSAGIFTQVYDYLRPLADISKNNKSSKSKPDQTLIRSLAKRFLPFLNSSLSVLPKHLTNISKSGSSDGAVVLELFQVFKLCLDCLESVASQLESKPFSVEFLRVRMVQCLEACGRVDEAEAEGLRILENLRSTSKSTKRKAKILPEVDKDGVADKDKELSLLVVQIVVALVRCAAVGTSKEYGRFRRVLDLVEEVRPWLRGLGASSYDKHQALVINLGKCALSLLGKTCSDKDLVVSFCRMTLTEYVKSPVNNQVYKIARRMCSSLLALQGDESLYIIDIFDCVASECKLEEGSAGIEFIELVNYCANKCQPANASFCNTFAAYLNKIAERFQKVLTPINSVLRLYAAGLLLVSCGLRSKVGDLAASESAKFECLLGTLMENQKMIQTSPPLLGQAFAWLDSGCESYMTYLPSYSEALKFLCKPLAKSVNSERKQLVTEEDDASAITMLSTVQDAFYILCQILLSSLSFTSEKNTDEFDENSRTLLNVALATFTLSIRTNLKLQESTRLVKQMMASKWIDTEGMKYIIASLYNIAVALYRNKQPNEASKVLNLCCKASWICIKCYCANLTEGVPKEFVIEAYKRSALLLDILYDISSLKIRKKVIKILTNWSTANNLFQDLPTPIPVLKQWVKIECKQAKQVDEEDDSLTLYSLLSSSTEFSMRNISIILEQELQAYEEINLKYPEFCQKMQRKIINILLKDIYITPDTCFQKAQTLVRKGKALRMCGTGDLRDCIQCFSEAITIMKEIFGETGADKNAIEYQLSVAYCMRALCTQEAEPSSKQIFEDVKATLDLWLGISPLGCFEDGDCYLPDSIMILLCNIIDLIQLKGFMELSSNAYKLLTRMFKWKNVSIEKWLTFLWESRRLSHALCVSPICEAFQNSLEHFNELSNIESWTRYLQGNHSSLIGFQQIFSFLLSSAHKNSCCNGDSFQNDITADDVQKAALELISNVSVPNHSTFLAGYLYYDLCPRLVANGRLIEALSFAKEAHKLHSKLFHLKFTHVVKQMNEEHNVIVDFSKNLRDGVDRIEVSKSVARETLLFDSISWNLEEFYLSPWKILQCYLESTLQVGIILEMIGDATESETYLQWGKAISDSLQLPLFTVAFSSLLGKLYVKKRHWDLAEKELQSAQEIFKKSNTMLCCSKCKLILEVTFNHFFGDLCQSKFDSCEGTTNGKTAKYWFTSALDKLNLSVWKNSLSCPDNGSDETAMDVKCGSAKICTCSTMNEMGEKVRKSMKAGPASKIGEKQNKKTKNAAKVLSKDTNLSIENKPRITRSKYRASQNQDISISSKSEVVQSVDGNFISNPSCMLHRKESDLNTAATCIFSKMRCWHCLPSEVLESGLLTDFINLKWEFVRRKMSMKLLTQLVKCFAYPNQIDEVHNVLLRSVSVLASRNPFYQTFSSIPLDYFVLMVPKEIPGDVFTIERAEIVYEICWYSLKGYHSKAARNVFRNVNSIRFEDLASWLMVAFILSREVSVIFQKVSKLLAVIHVSTLREQISMSSLSQTLSENYWASYFHQASIGTHYTHQFLSNLTGRCKGSYISKSCKQEGSFNLLRLVPDTSADLAEYVKKFLASLPSTTIICISFLGHDYASLLQELLLYPTSVKVWMQVSRLSFKSEPIVMLLPLDSILQDSNEDDLITGTLLEKPSENWHCPWGFTAVDDVAPAFRTILEENYLSSLSPFEDTPQNRILWWKRRKNLDHRLDELLRNIEDLWFGPWKCLLLGEWLNCKNFDLVLKNLANDLRSKCKIDVNESLLKVILGGSKHVCEGKTIVSQLCSRKDCYVAKVGYCDEARSGVFLNAANEFGVSSEVAFQLLNDALEVLEVDDTVNREPVILVLDYEVQMLPWESLPILRNLEVYRMPSVSSISAVLDISGIHQEQEGRNLVSFPSIDPLDAFYLLNPDGDLSRTQIEFENWFRDQNLEGKAGSKPTVKELASALTSHDLFIYFGHGSGAQYIPRHEIQKLEKCAATLLMGCSSGSLTLQGSYVPQGVPLSYLLAGSPVIVANLWEVTDKDIDRFGKAMLDAWLKQRSDLPKECFQCNLLSEEFEAMNLKGKAKRKGARKKVQESAETDSPRINCGHRPKIGAFMGQAREVCTLPFLTGASPICYGVPTGIWRKNNI
ncbi:hypothetical protein HN51_030706 [Arachis hypogaea]